MMRPIPSDLIIDCVDILSGQGVKSASRLKNAEYFLADLGYTDSLANGADTDRYNHRLNILKCASRMDLFMLTVPNAPGLFFIGGTVEPDLFDGYSNYPVSSSSGISTTLADAFEACVAEGIEYLSQYPETNDLANQGVRRTSSSPNPCWGRYHRMEAVREASSFLEARDCATQRVSEVPIELCLRNSPNTLPHGMSTGCASGNSHKEATVSALLELVERDAAALWWEGGHRPRPISAESLAAAGIESLYLSCGRNIDEKTTLILDITNDIGIPSVVAISTDQSTGAQFSCGLASRVNLKDAIYKAVLEMLQMELGHHVIAMKQKLRGDEALNEKDTIQLNRSSSLKDIWTRSCVQTEGPPRNPTNNIEGSSQSLSFILGQLKSLEYSAYTVDLTRQSLGVPVVKAFVPELQTYPVISSTDRLDVPPDIRDRNPSESLL